MMTRSGNLLLLAKVALNKPKVASSEVSVQTDPVKFSSTEDQEGNGSQPGNPILLGRSGNCGHDYVRPTETDVIEVPSGNTYVDSGCQADFGEGLDNGAADGLTPPITNILEEIVQDFDPDQWADLFNQQDNLDEILHTGYRIEKTSAVEEIVDSIKSYEGNLAAAQLEKPAKETHVVVIPADFDEDIKPVLYSVRQEELEANDEEENLVYEMSYAPPETKQHGRKVVSSSDNMCLWELCSMQFEKPQDLFEHIKDVHVDPTLPMVMGGGFYCCINDCPVPDRKFTKRFWLLDHIRRRHIPVGLFHCSECDKSFCTKELVRRHLKSHKSLEIRDYKCRQCPKTFRHSTDLSRHKKTHKDKRPFKCKFPNCGKDYTDHSGLRKHLSLHHLDERDRQLYNQINEPQPVSADIDDFDDPILYLEAANETNKISFYGSVEASTSHTPGDRSGRPAVASKQATGVPSQPEPSATPGKLNKDMILRLFNIPTLVVETPQAEEQKVFWLKRIN